MVLKERLTTAPILLYPFFSISFTLYTNTIEDSIRLNSLRYNMVENMLLFTLDNTFQTLKKSAWSLHRSRGPPSPKTAYVTV